MKRIACFFGYHTWGITAECTCIYCKKTRTVEDYWDHDWRNDCEKCSGCGQTRDNAHEWQGCECLRCGKKLDGGHNWDRCKCTKCGALRDYGHFWNAKSPRHYWEGCKCRACGAVRDEEHTWEGCKCTDCGEVRDTNHTWGDRLCSVCGREPSDAQLPVYLRALGKENTPKLALQFARYSGSRTGTLAKEILLNIGDKAIGPLTSTFTEPDVYIMPVISLLNELQWTPEKEDHLVYNYVFKGDASHLEALGSRALQPLVALVACLCNHYEHYSAPWHGYAQTIVTALSNLGEEAGKAVIPLLGDKREHQRRIGIDVLAGIRSPAFTKFLIDSLSDRTESVRTAAVHALEKHDEEQSRMALLALFDKEKKIDVLRALAGVLGRLKEQRAVPRLSEHLENNLISGEAAHALSSIASSDTETRLISSLNRADLLPTLVGGVCDALVRLKSVSAIDKLVSCYNQIDIQKGSWSNNCGVLETVGNSILKLVREVPGEIPTQTLQKVLGMSTKEHRYQFHDDPSDDPSTPYSSLSYEWATAGFNVAELKDLVKSELALRSP